MESGLNVLMVIDTGRRKGRGDYNIIFDMKGRIDFD